MKRFNSKFPFSVAFLIVFLLASSVAAQLRPTPTIRVKITEVPVDVVVLDSENRPVLGLRQSDFTILEDNVKQQTTHFAVERFDQAPKAIAGQERLEALSKFGPTSHRTILIVVGRGRHAWFNTMPVLTQFIQDQLQPNDLVAVMAYNRATDFTRDRAALVSVLKRYQERSGDIEATLELRQSGIQAVYGSRKYGDKLQADIDTIFEPVRARELVPQRSAEARENESRARESLSMAERQALRDGISGTEEAQRNAEARFPIQPAVDGPAFDTFERVEFKLLTDFGFDDYIFYRAGAEEDLHHLFAAIQYLRFMEGEKHLIFLHNQGLVLSRLDHEKSLANVASDARVRLHVVQTGGTWVPGEEAQRGFKTGAGLAEQPSSGVYDTAAITTFRPRSGGGHVSMSNALNRTEKLAEMTGGLAFSHKDIKPSLEAINASNQSAYLLGYRPKIDAMDGRFHRIVVTVNRPGLRVLHRRGYYAYEVLRPYDRRDFMTHARIAAALEYGDSIADLKFVVETKAVTGAEAGKQPFEAVVGFVPPADVFAVDAAGQHRGRLAVSYFVLSPERALLTEAWDDLDMNLKEETFQRAVAGGLRVHKKLTLPADTRVARLKVVLYDVSNDRLGSQEVRIEF